MEDENKTGIPADGQVPETAAAAEETPQPAPEAQPVVRSRKFIEEIYPDKTFDSDQAYEDALVEYLDGAKQHLAENDEANAAIAEILMDHPEFAEIIDDLVAGVPLRVALGKHFDPEELQVGDDEEDAGKSQEALATRRQRRADSEGRIREYEANMVASDQDIREFAGELGWDDEKRDGFLKWMEGFILDAARGNIRKPILAKLKQAFEYEEKVAEARETGEVDGRNAAIEARRVKQLEGTDGLPVGGAGAVMVAETEPEAPDFMDDVLERQKKRKW